MDPIALQLREIHLPPPASWWPPAPGWWLILAGILAVILAARIWWRLSPTRRTRRMSLQALKEIELAWQRSGDPHQCAQDLSRLLRRLALLAYGRRGASCVGEMLFERLAALGAGPLPADLAALLREAPYSRNAARHEDGPRYDAAIASLRPWLARLRAQKPFNEDEPDASF